MIAEDVRFVLSFTGIGIAVVIVTLAVSIALFLLVRRRSNEDPR